MYVKIALKHIKLLKYFYNYVGSILVNVNDAANKYHCNGTMKEKNL